MDLSPSKRVQHTSWRLASVELPRSGSSSRRARARIVPCVRARASRGRAQTVRECAHQAEGWTSRLQKGCSALHGAWRASSFRVRGLRAEERERGSCRACERVRLAGGRRQCGSAKAVAATTAAADSRVIIFVVVIIIIIIIIIIINIITNTTTTRAARLRGIRTSPSSLGGT